VTAPTGDMAEQASSSAGPLAGLRVVDCSSVVAGPACARYLADFGADVIKVERPDGGDTTRAMGWTDPRDGVSLWWKLEGRGKRSIVLDLKTAQGRDAMLRLCATTDVLVESFRPGTLERLGLGPDVLLRENAHLVIVRVTGFGQDGPYSSRPGFATLAEAMSGFAAINGEPGGPPLLPPIALTDEVTGLAAAFAAIVGVYSRVGQVVDISLLESLFQIMGPLISAHSLLGYAQPRLGSGIPYTVPRGTYRTADGHWVAVSTSSESVAQRLASIIGMGDDKRMNSFQERVHHRQEIEEMVSSWIGARTLDEVKSAFEQGNAAMAPVMSMAEIATDPHFAARGSIVSVDGVPMQGLIARFSATPGNIRWAGRPLGADTAEVLGEIDSA
jgi:crotonobetainyl-CoA:carnitine CoA-transferase CaiB-like acyl-CoA transferase